MWDEAEESQQVTAHTRARPLDHGVMVRPSGLLPSLRHKPHGSKVAGTLTEERVRWTMSLRAACLPLLLRQLRPWTPEASTRDPQREQE